MSHRIYIKRKGMLVKTEIVGLAVDVKQHLNDVGLRKLRISTNADVDSPVFVIVK